MVHTLPHDTQSFDFKDIFIGREQQIADFERLLHHWQHLMATQPPDDELITDIPSPHNKIQSLVVMLYGRGGFGKTILLRRYHGIATHINQSSLAGKFIVCKPIDWENALDDRIRALFNPQLNQSIDPVTYYNTLCDRLAHTLNKQPKEFRFYQQVVCEVENARKEASKVLEELQRDQNDRFKELRGASIEILSTLISTTSPIAKVIAGNEKVKQGADAALKLTVEQITHIREKLRRRIGEQFAEMLSPARSLSLALGNDLRSFAQNYPLLFFFDTYEEIDEADALLQFVMGASGPRVGWVIAGRDNLWSGVSQRKRTLVPEHGYKEITCFDRSLSVNFNSEDVGAFTLDNIREYFDQLCRIYPRFPHLPALTNDDIARLWDITQGIPLAVNIVAAIYTETPDMQFITSPVDGQGEIIDQMVRRYLLHTRIALEERTKLYMIALLRRPDQQALLATALGLTSEEANQANRFDEELSRLHRRYSFIFTEKAKPTLHEEVRKFLRLWLLERSTQPDILALNAQLTATHEKVLQQMETERGYTCLKDRLQDAEWTASYLDLTEQLFWIDPVQGLSYLLPLMIAASIYQRDLNRSTAKIGGFFAAKLRLPYRNWWQWARDSLVSLHNHNPSPEARTGLEELHHLLQQQRLTPSPYIKQQEELKAALWWRLGEAHQYIDDMKALICYETALTYLLHDPDLKAALVEICCTFANQLWDRDNIQSLEFAIKAFVLGPDYVSTQISRRGLIFFLPGQDRQDNDMDSILVLRFTPQDVAAYTNLGYAFAKLDQYHQAIDDYTQAIRLNPDLAAAYNNRGITFARQFQSKEAIDDFTQAIRLNPDLAGAYFNRGITFARQFQSKEAIDDYTQAIRLNPDYTTTYNNRGLAFYNLGQYQQAIDDFTQAIRLNPDLAGAHNNRGLAFYNLGQYQQAIDDFTQAIDNVTQAIDNVTQTIRIKSDLAALVAAYNNRSLTSEQQERYEKAINDFARTICLDLDLAAAYNNRSLTSERQEQHKEAIDDYTQAIRPNPDLAAAYNNRSLTSERQEQHKEAIDDYTQAIRLNPDLAGAYFYRGLTFHRQEQYKEAIDDYTQAIHLNPDLAAAYNNRGIALLHLKNKELAYVDFITGAEKDPQKVYIGWMALWTSFDTQRPNKDIAERLEKIAAINPQQYEASLCRAVASALRGKIKEGLALLEQARRERPAYEDTHFWYGMLSAYYYQDRPETAIAAIEKALEYRLPPLLLTPLYWLERDRPDFFKNYAKPLLDRYSI